MGEMVDFHLITDRFTAAMDEMNRVTDKATLYALRATGRKVVSAAKKKAPVYTEGLDPRAAAESGNLKKSISNSRTIQHLGTGDYSMKVGPFGRKKKGTGVVRYANKPGTNLSQSLANARAGAGGMRTTVGSRNRKARVGNSSDGAVRGVPLYRSKMEDEYGYMEAGMSIGVAEMARVYEAALAKAYERFR